MLRRMRRARRPRWMRLMLTWRLSYVSFSILGTGTCRAVWTAMGDAPRSKVLTYIDAILSISATDLFDRP